jgi:hypothetical protein
MFLCSDICKDDWFCNGPCLSLLSFTSHKKIIAFISFPCNVVIWTFLPFQIANKLISFHSIAIWSSCTNLANKQMVIYCNIMYFFWKTIFQSEWYIFFLHKWTLGTLFLPIHSILGTFQYYMLQKDVSFGYPIVGTNPSITHYSINLVKYHVHDNEDFFLITFNTT